MPETQLKQRAEKYFTSLQETICRELETLDGKASFGEDVWNHSEGGGGRTRVIQNGGVFEKGGVNFSAITSQLSEKLASRLSVEQQNIFATGISLVLHPLSPMMPTVHLNLRYLELANGDCWFGGGTDLTPYYLYEDDAQHFHHTLKSACDKHAIEYYPHFKKLCDEYFLLPHRGEARGIGGIFFDYQRNNPEKFFAFIQDVGNCFLPAYLPIVKRRIHEPWGVKEKEWQLIRRGRYVEFNLIYDRGTLFGLETGGRTESILMSLPPEVKWAYDHHPEPGSREEHLLSILKQPRSWV
jgi:coproporphyrinogen III oxidase